MNGMDFTDIALAAALAKGSGGGGGTSDYEELSNKPSINGNQLIGDKTSAQLGIVETWVGTQAEYQTNPPATGQPYIITDDTDIDATPTQGSSNPVTSDGVFKSLAWLNTTTGDIYFGQTRIARLMDYDSYAALTTKESIYYLTYPTPSQNSGRSLQTSPLTENENSDGEDIRTETEEPAPNESEMR